MESYPKTLLLYSPPWETTTSKFFPYFWNVISDDMLVIFSLWLYCPILGHGHLHETFRFILVTRSRTVSSTPFTGDQLVTRTLLTAPGDCDNDGEVGGINGFGRGNRSTRRKPASTPLCPTTNPTCQTRARTRAAPVGSQRLTTSAVARPRVAHINTKMTFHTNLQAGL
jgi:hypothetical protein